MGTLKYCKPSTHLVVRGDMLVLLFSWTSPLVFSVVFLVLHLCQMTAGGGRVTTGPARFSPESQRQTRVTFHLFFFFSSAS
ncbi:hypothetical protein EXN66_Car021543 [Channa argus]|uniref:Uncharacterized protein n=1 Tax=Channa argus TaxID=215402 RepID=A0A6G1QTC6_CHAAH|nr:hypothetical protein EXN66_Car021543 [Channa argus]